MKLCKFVPDIQVYLLLSLYLLTFVSSQDECTDTFKCLSSTCKSCTTCQAGDDDPGPCEGVRLNLFSSDDDFCDCCPTTCIRYLGEGEKCWRSKTGGNVHGMCGPGLTCGLDSTCTTISDTNCMISLLNYHQDLASGNLGMYQIAPQCDPEGDWAPVQCSGTDTCRCVDKETGRPIYGLETNMTAVDGMDCACSRYIEETVKLGCGMEVEYGGPSVNSEQRYEESYAACMSERSSYFPGHLRCQTNGNFDTAQCIDQTTDPAAYPAYSLEECFCYYPGVKFNSSIAPINIAHVLLPCHHLDEEHFQGFYRPCEKKHVDLKKTKELYLAEGKTYISNEWLEDCSIDGFYSKVQRNPENPEEGYCADIFGNKLEGYIGTFSLMDCECATVRNLTNGWGDKPACDSLGSGSYRNRQCKGGKCYCVDMYGVQCKKEEDEFSDVNCPAFVDPNTNIETEDKAPKSCS